ncbi:hypothetical protein AB7C87_23515 [Natrarchaeobius sp. A-rgal3]|uniref:hypothetical protein n=1 Tax=Natrarchaeobius versutus TaxID=1679078 RepID=UPI00350F7AFF
MTDFSEREKAIVACTLAAGFVMGMWAGLWMLPVEALDVPVHESQQNGHTTTSPAFYPVPSVFFGVTIGLPLVAVGYGYLKTRDVPEEATDEDVRHAVADGGLDE